MLIILSLSESILYLPHLLCNWDRTLGTEQVQTVNG
jgi:hypothetical protein